MKCKYCNGTGEVEVVGDSVTDVCDKCGGTGFFCEMRMGDRCTLGSPCPHQKPLTNEEWFCGLSTEEKAEFFVKIELSAMHPVKRGAVDMEKFIEEVVDWLEQPHREG